MSVRIVLIGQAAFAEQVLKGLVARGDDVAAVYCPPDGGRPDPVKQRALDAGIPVRQPQSYKPDAVRAEVAALAPDLVVLAYVTQIIPASVIAVARLGSICFHPSLLPRYRGGSAINWQLIKGETVAGVSVFWTDAGIDTGPILVQHEVPIDPNDSAGSLYYSKIFPAGVEAVLESVALIAENRAPRVPQDERRATYDPLCRDAHAEIDWTQPAPTVHNLIRGCDPQPGAHTAAGAARIRLYESRLEERRADGAPGSLLALHDGAAVVAARGGVLRLGKARVEGTKDKRTAAEVLAALGLTLGSRLGG
jgi:methionyl-tRNA formyltransferase